eukprot:m.105439 g.105439  ORF g.105439 m.105439 type:complete len:256 (+) comp27648_c0_seq1:126-893(+)
MIVTILLVLGLRFPIVAGREHSHVYPQLSLAFIDDEDNTLLNKNMVVNHRMHQLDFDGIRLKPKGRVRRNETSNYLPRFENSAIMMSGSNYYVNYDQPEGNLTYVLEYCYADARCVAFDFDGGKGWLHAVAHDCAATAGSGAQFMDGSSPGSTFYELTPIALATKGLNASCANARETYTPDYGSVADRVIGATTGTLVSFTLCLGLFYSYLHNRERSRRIANIINRAVGMNDGDDDDAPIPLAGPNARLLRNQFP